VVGPEENGEKTKDMLMFHNHNAGPNNDIKTANRPFENVAKIKYMGTTVINQNLIRKVIKRRLNMANSYWAGS
jgi:hypothetical protein